MFQCFHNTKIVFIMTWIYLVVNGSTRATCRHGIAILTITPVDQINKEGKLELAGILMLENVNEFQNVEACLIFYHRNPRKHN